MFQEVADLWPSAAACKATSMCTRDSSTTSCRLMRVAGLALCMARLCRRRQARSCIPGPRLWTSQVVVPKTEQTHFTQPPSPLTSSGSRTLARPYHAAGNAAHTTHAAISHGSLPAPCNRSCTGLSTSAPQYCASSPLSVVTVPVSMQVASLSPCRLLKQACLRPCVFGKLHAPWQVRGDNYSMAGLDFWRSRQRLLHRSPTSYPD
jgi:hypothetical protein